MRALVLVEEKGVGPQCHDADGDANMTCGLGPVVGDAGAGDGDDINGALSRDICPGGPVGYDAAAARVFAPVGVECIPYFPVTGGSRPVIESSAADATDPVVSCCYISDPPSLICGTRSGALLSIPPPEHGGGAGLASSATPASVAGLVQDPSEFVVGEVDSGILAVAASSDEELVAVVTGALTVVLMTADFDVVSECELCASGAPSAEAAGVAASVAWRADGECFAVSFKARGEAAASMVVVSRLGEIEARAEVLEEDEHGVMVSPHAVDWRPSGEIIATARTFGSASGARPDRVSFHERNGLGHYHFDLPVGQRARVLRWSPGSDVLAVGTDDTVFLYHRGNYHWCRKWAVPLPGGAARNALFWDPARQLSLVVVPTASKRDAQRWTFRWDAATIDPGGSGTAAIVDHDTVRLTPFAVSNVPPPMAACQVRVPGACEVAFLPAAAAAAAAAAEAAEASGGGSSSCSGPASPAWSAQLRGPAGVAVVRADRSILLLTGYDPANARELRRAAPRRVAVVPAPEDGSRPRFVSWIDPHTLVFAARAPTADSGGGGDDVVVVRLAEVDLALPKGPVPVPEADDDAGTPVAAVSVARVRAPARVTSIAQSPCGSLVSVVAGRQSLRLRLAVRRQERPRLEPQLALPSDACLWTALVRLDDGVDAEDGGSAGSGGDFDHGAGPAWGPQGSWALVARDIRNRLYVGGTEISQECTSFVPCGGGVIGFTTLSHTLKFVNVAQALSRAPAAAPSAGSGGGGNIGSGGNIGNGGGKDGGAAAATPSTRSADSSVRVVERGSLAVCSVARLGRVVLQVPRGNLETVAPRALTLRTVRTLLRCARYGEALTAMRTHRIDMNVTYDHDPGRFVGPGAAELVDQTMRNPELVTLFLEALVPDDVTSTVYVGYQSKTRARSPHQPHPDGSGAASEAAPREGADKVNAACDAVRRALVARVGGGDPLALGSTRHMPAYLATFVQRSPPDIEGALAAAHAMRTTRERTAAIERLTVRTDPRSLYKVALGTYDLALVLAVAQAAPTMDPREYLPFLGGIEAVPAGPRRRLAIDTHLARWRLALADLIACGPDAADEVMDLVRERDLHVAAIDAFEGHITRGAADAVALGGADVDHCAAMLARVNAAFGDSLSSERAEPSLAAICYRRAGRGHLRAAMRCHVRATEPDLAFACAIRLGEPPEELAELASELADQLSAEGRHAEAAIIVDAHGTAGANRELGGGSPTDGDGKEDLFAAARLATMAGSWSLAERLAGRAWARAGRPGADGTGEDGAGEDTPTRALRALATTAASDKLEALEATMESWRTRHQRLREVRAEKDAMRALEAGDAGCDGFDDARSEAFSNASTAASSVKSSGSARSGRSGMSGRSRWSQASGKSKRAARRWDRKGGPFEEDFLVDFLLRLFPSVEEQRGVGSLVGALLRLGERSLARRLRDAFRDMVALMLPSVPDLYVRETDEEKEARIARADIYEPKRPGVAPAREVVSWETPLLLE